MMTDDRKGRQIMTREELLKVAKPILFNTEMVQAILSNRKTVTRRLIKPQPPEGYDYSQGLSNLFYAKFLNSNSEIFLSKTPYMAPCLNEEVGDILYVRETFCEVPYEYEHIPIEGGHITVPKIAYKADAEVDYTGIWKPSIHMPKELARIFLKVTDVRVERLQDITEQQALNEGIKIHPIVDIFHKPKCHVYGDKYNDTAIQAFSELWDGIYKNKGYGWDANPWVWVIEFERVEEE